MTVATRTAVELVRFLPETPRAGELLRALQHASERSGIQLTITDAYKGACPWLVLWGPGAPVRAEAMRRHVAAGGHAIAFDLAYWARDRKVRVSIDAPHPQAWVMRRDLPDTRLRADNVPIANGWNIDGQVVIAGIGRKAQVQYGGQVEAWEQGMLAACRLRWPKRPVRYRPKPVGSVPNIDAYLVGASLVVTWHSNIAVDAIRMGIPAICMDGAAAAVCPQSLPLEGDPIPLAPAVRDRFLANLAWFQWAPSEAKACWYFLQETLA